MISPYVHLPDNTRQLNPNIRLRSFAPSLLGFDTMPYLSTRLRHLHSEAKRQGGELENRYLTVAIQPPPEGTLDTLDHGEDSYKYKFRPLPPQNDPILHLMKTIIRELNRENMAFAAAHVRIHATTAAPPFWPIDPQYPVYDAKLYTFMMDEPFGEPGDMSAIGLDPLAHPLGKSGQTTYSASPHVG